MKNFFLRVDKLVSWAFVFLLIGSPACAEAGVEAPEDYHYKNEIRLNMSNAVEYALSNMEDLRIASAEKERSYHVYRQTKTLIYPEIAGHFDWTKNTRYPVNIRYPAGAISDYEIGLGASLKQLIWSSGRVSNAVKAARMGYEMGILGQDVKKEDIVYEAKVAYITAIFAETALAIAESSHRNSIENKKMLQERSATGRVSRKDNIKVESDIAARVPLVTGFEADLESAKNTIRRITGLAREENIVFAENFEEDYSVKEIDELILLMAEKEPTLKLFEKNILLKGHEIARERAEYLPNIYGFFTWDYRGRSDQDKNWYIGKERLMDQFGVIGLRAEVPIFDMGRVREKVRQVEAEREKARLELEKLSADLVLNLRNAVSVHNKNVEKLEANKRAVKLSKETFRLFRDLFLTGQVTLLELNDAELALTREKLEKAATLYDLNIALARIERLTTGGRGL